MSQKVNVTFRHNGRVVITMRPDDFKILHNTVRSQLGLENLPSDPIIVRSLADTQLAMRTFKDRNQDLFPES